MAAEVGVVLQARLGSNRLPGKALASIGGTSLLKRCLARLIKASVGPVILATTERPEDDALVLVARRFGVAVHRGSTDDVLQRYVDVAVRWGFDGVIRATGDNPAVDIDAPARLVAALKHRGGDYACEVGLPYGAGVELVTSAALMRAAAVATSPADREHVTTYVKRQGPLFTSVSVAAPAPLHRPDLRLTIDTPADLAFMRRVFARVRSAESPLAEVIAAADECLRSDAA